MRYLKTSPCAPQPKQWKVRRAGETMKDGVFSLWKGQQALKSAEARLSGMREPISSTMSVRARISSSVCSEMRPDMTAFPARGYFAFFADLSFLA